MASSESCISSTKAEETRRMSSENDPPSSSSSSSSPGGDDAPSSGNEDNMALEDQLTVVIVSSPTFLHPSTTLVERVVTSFSCIDGLDKCPVIIVLDGFVIRPAPRTKKGQITEPMQAAYEGYHPKRT